MPIGHQIVQATHAALESAHAFGTVEDVFLVVLGIESPLALDKAYERLTGKGIRCQRFYEPDHDFGHTALASEPITSNQKRKAFYLYRKWEYAGVLEDAV